MKTIHKYGHYVKEEGICFFLLTMSFCMFLLTVTIVVKSYCDIGSSVVNKKVVVEKKYRSISDLLRNHEDAR